MNFIFDSLIKKQIVKITKSKKQVQKVNLSYSMSQKQKKMLSTVKPNNFIEQIIKSIWQQDNHEDNFNRYQKGIQITRNHKLEYDKLYSLKQMKKIQERHPYFNQCCDEEYENKEANIECSKLRRKVNNQQITLLIRKPISLGKQVCQNTFISKPISQKKDNIIAQPLQKKKILTYQTGMASRKSKEQKINQIQQRNTDGLQRVSSLAQFSTFKHVFNQNLPRNISSSVSSKSQQYMPMYDAVNSQFTSDIYLEQNPSGSTIFYSFPSTQNEN